MSYIFKLVFREFCLSQLYIKSTCEFTKKHEVNRGMNKNCKYYFKFPRENMWYSFFCLAYSFNMMNSSSIHFAANIEISFSLA